MANVELLAEFMIIPIPGLLILFTLLPRINPARPKIWRRLIIGISIFTTGWIYFHYSDTIDRFCHNTLDNSRYLLYLLSGFATISIAVLSIRDLAIIDRLKKHRKVIGALLLVSFLGYIYTTYLWIDISGTVYYQYKTTRNSDGRPTFTPNDYLPDSGAVVKLLEKYSFKPIRETTVGKDGRYEFNNVLVKYKSRLFAVVLYNHAIASARMSQEVLNFYPFDLSQVGVETSFAQDQLSNSVYNITHQLFGDSNLTKKQLFQLTKHSEELSRMYLHLFSKEVKTQWGINEKLNKFTGGYYLRIDAKSNNIDFRNTDGCRYNCTTP